MVEVSDSDYSNASPERKSILGLHALSNSLLEQTRQSLKNVNMLTEDLKLSERSRSRHSVIQEETEQCYTEKDTVVEKSGFKKPLPYNAIKSMAVLNKFGSSPRPKKDRQPFQNFIMNLHSQ